MELQIYWKNRSCQWVKALIGTGAEASLIYGNPEKCKGEKISITGGKQNEAVQTKTEMKIGTLPKQTYSVMIVPIPEYIIGIEMSNPAQYN